MIDFNGNVTHGYQCSLGPCYYNLWMLLMVGKLGVLECRSNDCGYIVPSPLNTGCTLILLGRPNLKGPRWQTVKAWEDRVTLETVKSKLQDWSMEMGDSVHWQRNYDNRALKPFITVEIQIDWLGNHGTCLQNRLTNKLLYRSATVATMPGVKEL
jgi:hypothetical protein